MENPDEPVPEDKRQNIANPALLEIGPRFPAAWRKSPASAQSA